MEHPLIDRGDFVIRNNNAQVAEPCAACGEIVDQPTGPALLTTDGAQVCMDCGQKYAPELATMLRAWQATER